MKAKESLFFFFTKVSSSKFVESCWNILIARQKIDPGCHHYFQLERLLACNTFKCSLWSGHFKTQIHRKLLNLDSNSCLQVNVTGYGSDSLHSGRIVQRNTKCSKPIVKGLHYSSSWYKGNGPSHKSVSYQVPPRGGG